MKVAIIIPAYNEERRIGKTLETYGNYFKEQKKKEKIDYEILVVINGTTDNTESIVKAHQKKNKSLHYLVLKRGGKGYAVIEGFKDVLKRNNDIIGFVDADMATSPEAFDELIQHIDSYDGVIASRYVDGAVVKPKQSIQRIIVSRFFNLLVRGLFFMPYRDTQCGAKAFTVRAIADVLPRLSIFQWAFDVELLYNLRKRGFHLKEVPTIWSDRKYSTINFLTAGPRMVLSIIRLRIEHSPLKIFILLRNAIMHEKK